MRLRRKKTVTRYAGRDLDAPRLISSEGNEQLIERHDRRGVQFPIWLCGGRGAPSKFDHLRAA